MQIRFHNQIAAHNAKRAAEAATNAKRAAESQDHADARAMAIVALMSSESAENHMMLAQEAPGDDPNTTSESARQAMESAIQAMEAATRAMRETLQTLW